MVSEKPPSTSRFRIALRFGLVLIALIGTGLTIQSSLRLRTLGQEYQRLGLAVGNLPIRDPGKVYVVAIPTSEKLEWRFRIYLPPNYQSREYYSSGHISATTPRHQGSSSGWSSSGPNREPTEYMMTVALIKSGDRWEFHTNTGNSRSQVSTDNRFEKLLNDSQPLSVEVIGQQQAVEVAMDEPICLLRLHGVDPEDRKDPADPLYSGFYYYLIPAARAGAFEAAQQGGRSSIPNK